jgi:hypothetical protein
MNGINYEFDGPKIKKVPSFGEGWTREECMKPIFFDPKEKVRYFVHTNGFSGSLRFVSLKGNKTFNHYLNKIGLGAANFNNTIRYVEENFWKEITKEEAIKLGGKIS